MVKLVLLLVVLLLVPGGSMLAAQSSDPDLDRTRPTRFNSSFSGGSGLVQAVSPDTLPHGAAVVGASVMNFDRDPGDIDLFEYSFQGAVGLGDHAEVFMRVMPWLRANSANQDPVRFPPPPLDLFVDTYPTPATRTGPPFMFFQGLPYKTFGLSNLTETGAFSVSTGNNVFGLKWNLRSQNRGDAAGIGFRGYIEVPTETPRYNVPFPGFRQDAGVSGKIDFGGDLLLGRKWKSSEFLGNIGFKQTGNPKRGLRVQMVDSSQTSPDTFLVGDPAEIPLRLSNELRLSAGWTVPLFHFYKAYWWLVAEFNHTHYVGSHTPTQRLVHPSEVSLGIQSNIPWYKAISVGASWQLQLNNGGKGQQRTTSLRTADGRGDINFSELLDNPAFTAEVEAFLKSRGATFSEASNRVFSTNNPAFDPWRNIPAGPDTIRSAGHTNILASITWHAGGRH